MDGAAVAAAVAATVVGALMLAAGRSIGMRLRRLWADRRRVVEVADAIVHHVLPHFTPPPAPEVDRVTLPARVAAVEAAVADAAAAAAAARHAVEAHTTVEEGHAQELSRLLADTLAELKAGNPEVRRTPRPAAGEATP